MDRVTRTEAESRLACLQRGLPRALPDAYRTLLLSDGSAEWAPYCPAHPGWEDLVGRFVREWHPLHGLLFPVEHRSQGLFACLHLVGPDEPPVVAWDITADLSEQPFMTLADDWDGYAHARGRDVERARAARQLGHARKTAAARERGEALQVFDRMVADFHVRYANGHGGQSFEHDADNAALKSEHWKPERLAVQDQLLGVMAYRHNQLSDTIDVAGFATRDHTAFARGSATAGLMVALLCELVSCGARAIRFLVGAPTPGSEASRPERWRVPYEVAVFGWVLGAQVRPGDVQISAAQAETMLLELTPFPPAVRRRLAASRVGIGRACLAVYRQIWSALETALLAEWCPQADALLCGQVDVGEQARYAGLLAHARAAAAVAFGQRAIQAAAPTEEAGAADFELLAGDGGVPYGAAFVPGYPTEWRLAAPSTQACVNVEAGRTLVLVGVPDGDALQQVLGGAGRLEQRVAAHYPGGARLLGVVPDRTEGVPATTPFPIVAADQDAGQLDQAVQRRLAQTRRLRA